MSHLQTHLQEPSVIYSEFVISIITVTPWNKFYYFHFTDEKSELREVHELSKSPNQ